VKGFESGAFSKYWGKGPEKKDHALRVVFHLCGNDVFEHEQYKAFMKRFEDDVHVSAPCSVRALSCSDTIEQHIVASRDHVPDPITFTSAAFNQLRLNHLDSNIFPVPKFSLEAKKTLNCALV
jgi:ribonuclease Z